MANRDGFNSSEVMYPPVPVAGEMPQQMMPAAPYAAPGMPAFGSALPRGPELLHGGFNQTWLLNCLRRRWLLALLMGALLGAAIAGLLMWLFPLSSSVTAMVHVQQEVEGLLEQQKHFSPQRLEIFQETQAALIKSQFILKSALIPREIAQLEAVQNQEPDPVTWLQDELQVGFQGETLFVRFSGEENSEEMKKIIQAVIAAYKNEVVKEERIRSKEMYEKLSKMKVDLTTELSEKVDKYQTLSAEFDGPESATANSMLNMLINEVRQIQSQIIKQKQELIDYEVNRRIAEQQLKSPAAVDQAVAEELDKDPTLASYQAEEFAIAQQIRALKAASKRGASAQIKRLESSFAQLERASYEYRAQAEKEIRETYRNAPNEAYAAVMTEYVLRRDNITASIKKLEQDYEAKVEEIQAKGISNGTLTMLKSEIEQLRDIESEMDYKLRSWSIQDQAANDLFRVLQEPIATPNINTIQRYALAGLGGIAAFCATCYGVALIEFRRRRLNGASDMDEGLGLRVLGVLPAVSSRKSMAPGSLLAAQLSESIDNVRATLMHDSTTKKRQVVLVTSPATMEGTTTVASHLALSLTRAGRRTLLIDGDIREPALHKLFGMPLDDGFSEVLRTDIDVSDAIRPTNTEGLWLLTAGHCDMDAVHALATDQPQPIFEKLRTEFDFIVIDGAPVLGLSDSLSLGQHVDGVVLTVLRDHSEVRKVHQSIELMKSMGIHLLGSVVNGVPVKADRRIVQLHKNAVPKKRQIAATASANVEKASAKVDDTVEEVVGDVNEAVDDFVVDVNDEVELDFDDLGLDDLKE